MLVSDKQLSHALKLTRALISEGNTTTFIYRSHLSPRMTCNHDVPRYITPDKCSQKPIDLRIQPNQSPDIPMIACRRITKLYRDQEWHVASLEHLSVRMQAAEYGSNSLEIDRLIDWSATHWAALPRDDPYSITPLQASRAATTRNLKPLAFSTISVPNHNNTNRQRSYSLSGIHRGNGDIVNRSLFAHCD